MALLPIEQHNIEIQQNLDFWNAKPLLQNIYKEYYRRILTYLKPDLQGQTVELGSGIGNFKAHFPGCICTDIFPNPWIDQVESAYQMSFADQSVSHLVMMDVWHHLEFPGEALKEFHRVLLPGGRLIILDPALSLLGLLVYGLLHHEPIGLFKPISWMAPTGADLSNTAYYAAQGNASRIFGGKQYLPLLADWKIVDRVKMSAISYIASGGFSKPALYPASALPVMQKVDRICDLFPWLFSTRLLVVLEKK